LQQRLKLILIEYWEASAGQSQICVSREAALTNVRIAETP
jgi:hypothetical protein